MQYLTDTTRTAHACGKAILIGEHAVVYGYHAVAMALPDIMLSITIHKPDSAKTYHSWEDVWETSVRGHSLDTKGKIALLFSQAFAKALSFCECPLSLSAYTPQRIQIHSDIPLGGGMGGSAAISSALIDIAAQICDKTLSYEQKVFYANEIDCLFHSGKASGLDVAAVASHGVIEFSKKNQAKNIKNVCSFWIALVDSNIRSETSTMIKRVAHELDTHTQKISAVLKNIGSLAEDAVHCLETGRLSALAEKINQSHLLLQTLGVSTKKLDQIVLELKAAGAMAAKLTGAGGGGLVLGLFDHEPTNLYSFFDKNDIFITKVKGGISYSVS